jgi:hypothetical protein
VAISWSSWDYSGNNGMRVGLDISWSSVVHASTTATATVEIWTENQYTYSDNQTLNISSNLGSDLNYTNNDGGAPQLRTTRTYTYTYGSTSYGTSPGTVTFTASVSGAYNGSEPSESVVSTIPARPATVPDAPVLTATVPAAPTGVSQINLSWTTPDNQGSALDAYVLQVSTSSSTTGFANLFTDSTVPLSTSYNHTGLPANTQHWYRVLASNGVGNSAYSTVRTGTTLGGIARVWNGSSFVSATAKVWNGTTWVEGQARVWNGTEWKYGI